MLQEQVHSFVILFINFSCGNVKKNHTHVKKVGHTSEVSFGIYGWTLKNPKNQNFQKMKKKLLEISSFYTRVPKTTIIWGKVPEIQRDRIFGHFGPYFTLLTPPSPSPNNPDNQNFEKIKKAPGDVITLDLCNKKHDHMMYAYSDMEGNRQFIHSFYPFRPPFALLPHCWPRKLKFAKYVENTWRYPFTHVYNTLRSYDAWFLRYKVQRTKFCHFGSFFALWPSQQPKKSKILKKLKKKGLEILSCYTYVS